MPKESSKKMNMNTNLKGVDLNATTSTMTATAATSDSNNGDSSGHGVGLGGMGLSGRFDISSALKKKGDKYWGNDATKTQMQSHHPSMSAAASTTEGTGRGGSVDGSRIAVTRGGVRKRAFVPNVKAAELKPVAPKSDSTETKPNNIVGSRGRGGRGGRGRGRGGGRNDRYTGEATGVFAQGVALKSQSGKAAALDAGSIVSVPGMDTLGGKSFTSGATESTKKGDSAREALRKRLQEEDEDDIGDEIDLDCQDAFVDDDPSEKPTQLPLMPKDDGFDGSTLKAWENLLHRSDDDPLPPRLIFFQTPDTFPSVIKDSSMDASQKVNQKVKVEESSGVKVNNVTADSVICDNKDVKSTTERSNALTELGNGLIGEIFLHKSGKMRLQMGNILFDITPGANINCLQEVIAVSQGENVSLGELNERLILTPDIEHLLSSVAAEKDSSLVE